MQEFGEGEIPNENYSATNLTHFKHVQYFSNRKGWRC